MQRGLKKKFTMGRNKRESQIQSDRRVTKAQDTMKVSVDTINMET